MKPLRVLSLFDGISCGHVALERVSLPIEVYYASEIDKYAIQITQKNYPNTIQLGDVEKIDFTQYEGKIDLLIGGSPCTNLSICGNRKGLEGNESRLFWEYVRAIKECKPKYFLLENVESMTDSDREIISKELGCYPIMINSSLVSAQNRKRYYWFNWGLMQYNLFGFPTCDIPQPKDKRILLKDILESGLAYQNKSYCLTSTDWKGLPFQSNLEKHRRTQVAEPICVNSLSGRADNLAKQPSLSDRIYDINGKSVTLASGWKPNIAEPVRLSQYEKSKGQAQRVYSVNAKTVAINANGGGQGGKTGLYKIDLPDGDYIIRKLTPIECERLQTLPDNYTEGISNSQRYKCLGNGWTVDVIAHIFSFLKEELESED